ncbi:MAG: hypothetical protein Q7V17_10670 [Afipia sp.]|nr:hypothetical protein [Afipia sp.]
MSVVIHRGRGASSRVAASSANPSHLYCFFIRHPGNSHRFLMRRGLSAWKPNHLWEVSMLDLLMLAIVFGLFILTMGYAIACDRL